MAGALIGGLLGGCIGTWHQYTDGQPGAYLRGWMVAGYIYRNVGGTDVICPNESAAPGFVYHCLAGGGERFTVHVRDLEGHYHVTKG